MQKTDAISHTRIMEDLWQEDLRLDIRMSLRFRPVSMTIDEKVGVAETARRLSISPKTLANWVAQYRQNNMTFSSRPSVDGHATELIRLKKEIALLRMERDILKKRRHTLPKSRCEVRRDQSVAT